MAHQFARPGVAGAQRRQQLIRLLPVRGLPGMEDRVHVQEVEVQDSIATMVEPVLAASSRGRRGS